MTWSRTASEACALTVLPTQRRVRHGAADARAGDGVDAVIEGRAGKGAVEDCKTDDMRHRQKTSRLVGVKQKMVGLDRRPCGVRS